MYISKILIYFSISKIFKNFKAFGMSLLVNKIYKSVYLFRHQIFPINVFFVINIQNFCKNFLILIVIFILIVKFLICWLIRFTIYFYFVILHSISKIYTYTNI